MRIHKYWPLAFLLGILFLPGCLKKDIRETTNQEFDDTDSVIRLYNDTVRIKPYTAIKKFTDTRKEVRDSLSSYNLLRAIASCYWFAGKIDSSLIIDYKILEFCNREHPTPDLLFFKADIFNKIGAVWDAMGMRDSSIIYYKKSYDLLMKIEDRHILPRVCNSLAFCYQQNNNYPMASYYFHRSSFVIDSLGSGNKIETYLSLACLYTEIENFDLAETYFILAEPLLNQSNDIAKFGYEFYRGKYYVDVKDYRNALEWYRKCYQTVMKVNPHPSQFMLLEINISEIFRELNQLDSAYHHIEKAKKFYQQTYGQPDIQFVLNGIEAALATETNQLGKAERLLMQPYDTAMINPAYIYEVNRTIEELYAKKNDYKNAYKYRIKVDTYNDSLRNTKVRNNIAEIDMRYKQDTTLLRKDLRIALVEGRASHWQNIASMSLLALVLITALATAFILYSRRKKEQEYRKQLATVTGLRMEIVRNRLSPHFMFNALNAVMPALNRHEELERPFGMLIQMLRGNLHASEQIAIPVHEEIKLVKDYLQLQMMGNPGGIQVEWEIADDVPGDTRIPSMSIQIPVENAVKYAFEPMHTDACLSIRVARHEDRVSITIDDNGVGYNPAPGAFNERGTGNGLKMLYRTVELLNLRNDRKMVFKIENKQSSPGDHGTRVTIIVPVGYHFGDPATKNAG